MSVLDWDIVKSQTISPFRFMDFQIPAVLATEADINALLAESPKAQIVRELSHEGREENKVRHTDGTQYLDEFGLPVYLISFIDWEGTLSDMDLRYENTNLTTNEYL